MARTLPQSRLKLITLVLLLAILLPALFYTVYEFNSLSDSERLIADVYDRQLRGLLFSLNQYSWDVASSWASTVTQMATEEKGEARDSLIARFVARTPAVEGVVLADSAATAVSLIPASSGSRREGIETLLRSNREKLDRLFRFRREDYRKLEPFPILAPAGADSSVLLMFAVIDARERGTLGGIVIRDSVFVTETLGPRLRDASAGEFALAVFRRSSGRTVFATTPVDPASVTQRGQLWLFPDQELGIRLQGRTVDEILRARFVRNVGLLLLLNLVLIGGLWFLYRALARELELSRMKSDFISTVSHELRTPLALIRMYAETLEMNRIADPVRRQEYLVTILRETERLSRLVNSILNFSRIEAGRKTYRMARVDLNALVEDVVETYRDHLSHHGFAPVLDLARDLPPMMADGEAVQESLINLVDNAVKYSPAEKFLRIRTGSTEGTVWVDVEDRGIGIAPKHRERIFEAFYRVADGLVHETKGSGLGLSLVRHVMDAHGGSVQVTSSPGAGSTFRLTFPSGATHPQEQRP